MNRAALRLLRARLPLTVLMIACTGVVAPRSSWAACPDFAAAVNYAVGNTPFSVATGDFNGDGKGDLAVANNGSNNVSILLGNGNGTFAAAVNYAAGTNPNSVAIGDFNSDGKGDLAVAQRLLQQCLDPAGQRQRDLRRGGELRRRHQSVLGGHRRLQRRREGRPRGQQLRFQQPSQ